jgi:predicted DNA-binding protein
MAVRLKPETESRLQQLAAKTGRLPEDLLEDAMAGYLIELTEVRGLLDNRYDQIKSGQVKPIDGDEAFASLRQKTKARRGS